MKYFLGILLLTISLSANSSVNIKQSLYNFDSDKESEIIALQEKTDFYMKWLYNLDEVEQSKVISVYRTVFEKLAQKIVEKIKADGQTYIPKYLRIIGIGDLLLYKYTKNEKLKSVFEKEVTMSIQYIGGRIGKEHLIATLIETNEVKTDFIVKMGGMEFERIKIDYNKEFEQTLPLLFKNLLQLELKIVSDEKIKEYFKK